MQGMVKNMHYKLDFFIRNRIIFLRIYLGELSEQFETGSVADPGLGSGAF